MAQGKNQENFFGYEQYMFVNSLPVPGVQSVQSSFNFPIFPLTQLGGDKALIVPRGDKVGQVSINTFLISSDPFFYLTGNQGVNGFLIKNLTNKFQDNFSFISGYLSSYTNQYSLGGLPQVQASFQVFSNMGKIGTSHPSSIVSELSSLSFSNTGLFQDVCQGCASVTFSESASNPLISYELSINCPRIPIFALNRDTPIHVLQGKPIEISLSMQFEDASFNTVNLKSYPYSTETEDITITLKNKDGQNINVYALGSMQLASTQKQSSTDSPDIRTLVYKRYLG